MSIHLAAVTMPRPMSIGINRRYQHCCLVALVIVSVDSIVVLVVLVVLADK